MVYSYSHDADCRQDSIQQILASDSAYTLWDCMQTHKAHSAYNMVMSQARVICNNVLMCVCVCVHSTANQPSVTCNCAVKVQRGKVGSRPLILHCHTAVSKAYCLHTDSEDTYRNGTDSALVVDIVNSTGAATYHHIGCTAQPSFTISHHHSPLLTFICQIRVPSHAISMTQEVYVIGKPRNWVPLDRHTPVLIAICSKYKAQHRCTAMVVSHAITHPYLTTRADLQLPHMQCSH